MSFAGGRQNARKVAGPIAWVTGGNVKISVDGKGRRRRSSGDQLYAAETVKLPV
jgi:hypothetical protein